MNPQAAPPVEVPWTELSEDALNGVLESFVLREGTDYGREEVQLATKIDEFVAVRVHEMAAFLLDESDLGHQAGNFFVQTRSQNEVEITRLICAFGVDRRDGPAHEESFDSMTSQVPGNEFPDFFLGARLPVRLFQVTGFPLRRGRRREGNVFSFSEIESWS